MNLLTLRYRVKGFCPVWNPMVTGKPDSLPVLCWHPPLPKIMVRRSLICSDCPAVAGSRRTISSSKGLWLRCLTILFQVKATVRRGDCREKRRNTLVLLFLQSYLYQCYLQFLGCQTDLPLPLLDPWDRGQIFSSLFYTHFLILVGTNIAFQTQNTWNLDIWELLQNSSRRPKRVVAQQ